MPRKARIDAPGALHHIIFRGIERRKIFRDNKDRDNFLDRLGNVLSDSRALLRLGANSQSANRNLLFYLRPVEPPVT
jgi:REP element-mobilizing transposase RayT